MTNSCDMWLDIILWLSQDNISRLLFFKGSSSKLAPLRKPSELYGAANTVGVRLSLLTLVFV